MTPEIALLLAQDGISTGAIYVLVALGIVLIFLVTRVIFVPFGDVVGYSALTLAALQLRQMPGTVWLVLTLAALATVMEVYGLVRRRQTRRLPKALLLYTVLPAAPAALVWLAAGHELDMWLAIALTLAVVLPISPLLYRVAFRPLADASVLVLLIIAVAVHFAMSGLALLYFGPEGFRSEPITRALFEVGPVTISGRGILIGPVTTLYYDSGFLIGLKAFVGAIIGGLVSYPAAAAGAIFVGLLESYAAFWDSALKEVFVFSALIPILIWQSFVLGNGIEEEIEEEEREGEA